MLASFVRKTSPFRNAQMESPLMQHLHTPLALREKIRQWREKGKRIALVPTMRALHEGHFSLVKLAQKQADKVVVSIFVNPTQFGPNEDFDRYPRTEAEDAEKLKAIRTDAVYMPAVTDMYPKGFSTSIHVFGVSDGLCGAVRPGHFDGVATVVTKLLRQVEPDCAVFGEKDYQQLQVIKRVVSDLNLDVAIIPAPILREEDGLAMSSRNRYLSPRERAIAAKIHAVLQHARHSIQANPTQLEEWLRQAELELLIAGFDSVDYVSLNNAEDLKPVRDLSKPARLLVAARLGKTRLIDNIAVEGRA